MAVPSDYADTAEHKALVSRLSTNSYLEAVNVLEDVPLTSWLAADILTGAPWARRYQNTTARLWMTDKKVAARGVRALMRVLSGYEAKVGRHRNGTLPPEVAAKAANLLATWRAVVDAEWAGERSELAARLIERAAFRFPMSVAHRRALKRLTRRTRLKKVDIVRAMASWESGIPQRRLRTVEGVADLVYG